MTGQENTGVEGVDYVWTVGRVPVVLFCRKCGSPDVSVGVRRNRVLKPSRGLSEAERYVPYIEAVTDLAHLDDYEVTCTGCTKAVGGWPTVIGAREYARRLAVVRELGYLPESEYWNAQRMNLARYLESEELRGMRSKADREQAGVEYVANGWGVKLR